MNRKVRWGILGAGRIAAKFASDLKHSSTSKLVAVASSDLKRAQDFAMQWGSELAFGSYDHLFETEIDVVYIATPHTFHKEHTLLCLNNGVGVLCEKPFAMNQADVEEMILMAEKKGLFLMEAMWTRFLPSIIKVKKLIDEGAIGQVSTIQADFGFKAEFNSKSRLFDMKLGGGALLDIGIYPAFLSLFLLGYPTGIEAVSIFSPTGSDTTTSFIFKYDEIATAVLNCTLAADTQCEAVIYGTEGKIVITSRFHEAKSITLFQNGKNPETLHFERPTFGYFYELEEVNNCIILGKKESDHMPLSLSKQLIHLLDKIRQKAGINYH